MPFSLSEGRSLSNLFNSNEQNNEHNSENLTIEKQNLICVFNLVVKDLLNSSLKRERLLEKEYFPLKHFFIVFEHILLHGFIGKKSFSIGSSSNRKDLWPIIELISKKSTDAHISQISISPKEMTNIRTPLGRVRAWLRLALMQKRLADYFKIIVEQKEELQELYENEALLLSDESIIITGLLVGLNVLDFNFCLKESALDYPIESNIHYNLYLRERRMPSMSFNNTHPPGAIQDPIDELDDYSSLSSASSLSPITKKSTQNGDTGVIMNSKNGRALDENIDISYDQRISNILDQKNYIEELNRILQKTVTSLQERVQALEQTNKSIIDDAIIQKTRVEELKVELAKVTLEKEEIQSSFQRKIQTLNADIDVERETYKKSRAGFDLIYNELQKKYDDERTSKQKIESVYENQVFQNNEFVKSTELMKNDIETKTTLYDTIKKENNHLLEKLQIEKTRSDVKEQQVQTMEKTNQMLRQTINELETNIEQINKERQALSETNKTLSQALAESDTEKTSLETDLRIEKQSYQGLDKRLQDEKEKVSMLQLDIHELNRMKEEYESLKNSMTKKQADFERVFEEQEETIRELALKLEESIKREHEFRERDRQPSSTWMKDEDVKECCQCKKDFGALRRKHHCRKCGQIFCEACVSTKLALSNSNKPVRVCDMCCTIVLAECAVNNP